MSVMVVGRSSRAARESPLLLDVDRRLCVPPSPTAELSVDEETALLLEKVSPIVECLHDGLIVGSLPRAQLAALEIGFHAIVRVCYNELGPSHTGLKCTRLQILLCIISLVVPVVPPKQFQLWLRTTIGTDPSPDSPWGLRDNLNNGCHIDAT